MSLDKSNNDQSVLEGFGYQQQLKRTMRGFSSFAASFAYLSILTGVFQTFNLGFNHGGPSFFWGWIVVLIGNTFIALNFAELAARYPLSGGIYQYSKFVASPFLGCITGWIFLACNIVTLAAVPLALQSTLPEVSSLFQIVGNAHNSHDSATNAIILAVTLLIVSIFLNTCAYQVLLKINNIMVILEIIFIAVLLCCLAFVSERGLHEVIFETSGRGPIFSLEYAPHFLMAVAFSASYVLYGYDTAGSLAEETIDPCKRAPISILLALWSAGLMATMVTVLALKAAPVLNAPELGGSSGGLAYIIKTVFPLWLGKVFCGAGVVAIVACTFSVHANVTRVIFSMARDCLLPYSEKLCTLSPHLGNLILAPIISGALAIILLLTHLAYEKVFEMIVSLAALWANLAYLFVVGSLLYARIKGWPEQTSGFYLGKLGLPINLIAFCWGVFMITNLAWPRSDLFGERSLSSYSAVILTALLLLSGIIFSILSKKNKS